MAKEARAVETTSGRSRRAAGLGSLRPLSGDGRAGGEARPRARERGEPRDFEARYKGKLKALAESPDGGAEARRGDRRVRGDRRDARPARQLCRAHLCRRHDRSGAREVLWRRAGQADRRSPRTSCSSGWSSTASTTRRWRRRWRRRRSPSIGRGSKILRLERPYQLEDRIEQLFHEKSVTGRGAWNRLFDETLATLRFDIDGEKLPLEPTLNRLVDPDEEKRKARRPMRLPRPSRRISGSSRTSPTCSPRTSRSPTNGAASRTWRRRGICRTASSRRWSMRWSPRCATPIRGSRIATTR